MPNKAKALGTSLERNVVERAKSKGLRSRKQPLSGVLEAFPNDVEVDRLLVECKVRTVALNAKGAKCLTFELDWLRGVQKNAEREGYEAGVVVMRPKGSSSLLVIAPFDYFLGQLAKVRGLTQTGGGSVNSE